MRRPHLAVLAAFLSGVAACFSAGCRKFRSFLLHVSWYFWRWVRWLLGWFRLLWPWQLLLFLMFKFFNLDRLWDPSLSYEPCQTNTTRNPASQRPTKTTLAGEALGSSQPYPPETSSRPPFGSPVILKVFGPSTPSLWALGPRRAPAGARHFADFAPPWIHETGLSGWTWTQYWVMN